MTLPAQFLPVKLVPRPNGKTDKFPLNKAGKVVDAHDPAHWMTEADARACGADTIGFVFTSSDPYGFMDFDDARSWDGTWLPVALDLFGKFRETGAACEISQSGSGLHVIGRVDPARVADRRNKFGKLTRPDKGNWCEFYFTGRFVAFGPNGWDGNIDVDITDAVLSVVPERDDNEAVELSNGPSPDWQGPVDDDELIKRMCASRGSMATMFGDKASIADLWTGKVESLAKAFPPIAGGDPYDRSSADMALMSHLAFWTGRDIARMDRLYRRSALMREKYDKRPGTYAFPSLVRAATACQKVYNQPPKVAPTPPGSLPPVPPPLGIMAPVVTTLETRHGFMSLTDLMGYFKGCIYVMQPHRIMVEGGDLLKPEQFKAFYGGYHFAMDSANEKFTTNAFEAFTENKAVDFPKARKMCFQPKETPGAIIGDQVNVYYPITVDRASGDVTPFLDFLTKLLPNDADRAQILAYMASLVQNPGVKFQWAPVLQGVEGNGKSLLTRVLWNAVGAKYSHLPAAEDLANPFNSYLMNKLFIGVEEIHMNGRRELLDNLKPIITNDKIEVQPKGVDKFMIDNVANWFFCTNHRDAVLKTKHDRRYGIYFTAQQTVEDLERDGMTGDYFPKLYNWLKDQGYKYVAEFLHTYAVPVALDPAGAMHRAPVTSSTGAAINASLGKAEQFVIEAVESEEPGFRKGWISSHKLTKLLDGVRLSLAPHKTRTMLADLGYVEVCRSTRVLNSEDGRRPVLYIRQDLWSDALGVDEYCHAQGYQMDMPPPAMVTPIRSVQG